VKSPSGGSITRLKVPSPDGESLFAIKQGVEEQAAAKLKQRFQRVRVAPICNDQLLEDFGHLGEKEANRQVLEGTYQCPQFTDKYTQLLLEEAAHISSKLGHQRVSNFVSISDFQDYWQHASEDTQSSFSGCHFGHFIAVSKDSYLSALHAAKISLATSTGTPLKRWGTSLTILLEKIAGNIFIDKMRAIHLLEDDYNWMNKLLFAKRMMDLAHG